MGGAILFLKRVISSAILSMAFLLLDGRIGPCSSEFRSAVASIVLGVSAIAAIARPIGWVRPLSIAAMIGLVARGPSTPLALSGFVVALAAMSPNRRREGGDRAIDGVILAFLSYLLGRAAVELWAPLGRVGLGVSGLIDRYTLAVTGNPLNASFTALGGPIVLFSSIYLTCRWRLSGNPARLILAAVVPLAWFLSTACVAAGTSAPPPIAFSRGVLLGITCLASSILLDALLREGGPARRPEPRVPVSRLVGCACLVAALAGVCSVGTSLIGHAESRRIVVHNRGGLDWDRPVFGRFGTFSGGMFGLLPVYCRAEGYDFGIIDKDAINPDDLAGSQILVLINSPKSWSGGERRTILDFVERGGSLLVLGDHTDVFGLMRGFNTLLDAFGIQFRFDSAYHVREGWRGSQVAAADAVAWGWDSENPSVAVGASLELAGHARPLLTGRYGFSDAGVRENVIGSFLGNYSLDRGESLGDVVLAATATRGRGRVMVWGDTSAFQGGLSFSYAKVVGPVLAWLSRPAAWTERPIPRMLGAIGLAAVVVGLWLVRVTATESAIVAAGLLAGLLAPWLLSLPNLDSRVTVGDDTFVIDHAHMPAAGHHDAHINSVGPLYSNLLRAGFRVVDRDSWDAEEVARARGIALIAPQRSFSSGEVDDLFRAEEAGATVLLAVGQPDSAASRRLLEAHGLALAPRPLGTVTASSPLASLREREKEPRFLDAWPITTVDGGEPGTLPGVEVIYRQGDDAVALFRRVGRGGLLVIGDTRFFSDTNVEGMAGHWPGNLALIHDALVRYAGARPDDVKPLFRSPEKPQ